MAMVQWYIVGHAGIAAAEEATQAPGTAGVYSSLSGVYIRSIWQWFSGI